MEKTVTATEVARKLSDILNAVKYNGSYYTIIRAGSLHLTYRQAGESKNPWRVKRTYKKSSCSWGRI